MNPGFNQRNALTSNRRAQRLLVGGFLLLIALLGLDGFMGFQSNLSIRSNVAMLTENHFRNVFLIDEVQRTQSALSTVLYRLAAGTSEQERAQLESSVDTIEATLKKLFASVPASDPEIGLWREADAASALVTEEADRFLQAPRSSKVDADRMVAARERLLAAIAQLIRANHFRAEVTKQQIDATSSQHLKRDTLLLSACLALACLCAWLVLRSAMRLYSQIEQQTVDLAQVSWQLLEKQEHLARRLSHELHDELGQSLTALKTNFTRHAAAPCTDPGWMADCSELLRDSIRSTHEISQLLRPTILDDFGLDSALAWLCERFEERQGVAVQFASDFHGRLQSEAETHVFRIAQEALTNVAKHAKSTKVTVALVASHQQLTLKIADNGGGLPAEPQSGARQFGLTGMKARARSLDGEMTIRSFAGRGTEIDVVIPLKEYDQEEKHSDPIGG